MNKYQTQDERKNAGWRIAMIPYGDRFKLMLMPQSGNVLFDLMPPLGALAFIGGFFFLALNQAKPEAGIDLTVGGLALALFGVWLGARKIRKNWEVTSAHCVDRELRRVRYRSGRGTSMWVWCWRIVCEHEYQGKRISVTPVVNWRPLLSEREANNFIERHISYDGTCRLHINPTNPLQTELVGQGIKEALLYNYKVGYLVFLAAAIGIGIPILRLFLYANNINHAR